MKDFRDLEVWKEARKLRNKVFLIAKAFPGDEKYRLTDQIIRSSRSITANISEGHGRYHYQENIQYCRQARGSLTETLDHLICALDIKYINQEKFKEMESDCAQILRLLNGYILYLRSRKSE